MYFSLLVANLGSVCAGAVMGWTSHALPYLQKPPHIIERSDAYNSTFIERSSSVPGNMSSVDVFLGKKGTITEGLTGTQASWVASLAPLGALVGALSAGYVANTIGRKKLLLGLGVLYLLGWSLIIVAGKRVSDLADVSCRQTGLM
jgi:MFS family permease